MITAAVLALSLASALVLLPVLIRLGGGYQDETEVTVCAGGALLAGLVGILYRKQGNRASLGLVVGRWWVMTLKTFVDDPDQARETSRDVPEAARGDASSTDGGQVAEDGDSDVGEARHAPPDESLWSRLHHMIELADRLRRPAYRFVKRLIASFRIRRLRADIHYGSGSPDTTGRAVGYASALRPLLGGRATLNLQPDFTRQRLSGTADLEIALWPARLVWAIACLMPHALTLWLMEKKRSRRKRKAA